VGSSVILPSPGQPKTGPDPSFQTAAYPNIVLFRYQDVDPPSPVYIQRGDEILMQAVSALAGDTITFNYRVLVPPLPQPGGQPDQPSAAAQGAAGAKNPTIVFGQVVIALPNAYALVKVQQPLAEGFLLSVTALGAVTQRGTAYARAFINRGNANAPFPGVPLFADYVTAQHPAGFPNGRFVYPTEGPGRLREITVGNPAAGADWSIPIGPSAQRRWRVQSLNAQLLTSAVVANRIPRLQLLDDAGNLVWQSAPSQVIVASTTAQVSAGQGQATATTDTTTVNVVLPGSTFMAGSAAIRSSTLNIQAADQWSNIFMEVEEWIDAT
jgi:hypothetical protein